MYQGVMTLANYRLFLSLLDLLVEWSSGIQFYLIEGGQSIDGLNFAALMDKAEYINHINKKHCDPLRKMLFPT